MDTVQLLLQKYKSITMTVLQLAELTGMQEKSVQNAISAVRFPIHTYRLCGRRVADIRDVAAFLDSQRDPASGVTRGRGRRGP